MSKSACSPGLSLLLFLQFVACSSGGGAGSGIGADVATAADSVWDETLEDTACTSNDDCLPAGVCNAFTGRCVECTNDFHCHEGQTCLEGRCQDGNMICVPLSMDCLDNLTLAQCLPDGSGYLPPQPCADEVSCTLDSCAGTEGCIHAPKDSACNDYNACTRDSCDKEKDCQNIWDDEVCGPKPAADLNPPSIEFGLALPGNQEEQSLEVSNNGLGQLKLTKIRIAGQAEPQVFTFRFDGALQTDLALVPPLLIDPGQKLGIVVVFDPPAVGLHEGVLEILTNDPGWKFGVLSAPLRGRGATENCLTAHPPQLSLEAAEPGKTVSGQVAVENCGIGSVPIYDIYLEKDSCADLSLGSHEGYLGDLASGTFIVVDVVFAPSAGTECTGKLVVENGTAATKLLVPITGTIKAD